MPLKADHPVVNKIHLKLFKENPMSSLILFLFLPLSKKCYPPPRKIHYFHEGLNNFAEFQKNTLISFACIERRKKNKGSHAPMRISQGVAGSVSVLSASAAEAGKRSSAFRSSMTSFMEASGTQRETNYSLIFNKFDCFTS